MQHNKTTLKIRYGTINAKEKPCIRQDRQSRIPLICLPQGDLPTVHSRYTHTHRSSALPGVFLGLPLPSLITKGYTGCILGGKSPSLSSALWRQYPGKTTGNHHRTTVIHCIVADGQCIQRCSMTWR